jgi:hypothetical protein
MGGESYLDNGDIVAGNPRITKQMLQTLHPILTAERSDK